MTAFLHRCGTLLSAVIEKEATGRPRGVAVLEFETEEARRVALTLSGMPLWPVSYCNMYNQSLEVKLKSSSSQPCNEAPVAPRVLGLGMQHSIFRHSHHSMQSQICF